MQYSYNWLKELSGTKKTIEELAEAITAHSAEVEEIEKTPQYLQEVLVGEILEVSPHPDADKLKVTKVTVDPERKEVLSIICGAPNVAPGQRVPVALPGTVLPNGLKLKEAKVRGEISQGMICAEDELAMSDDHSVIIELDKDAPIGMSLAELWQKDDSMIELDILADRGHDALSHEGIAREICAIEGRRFDRKVKKLEFAETNKLSVSIENNDICKRYMGVVMENIEVKPSPEWMQNRLELCGIRPINIIVDVTNYVMLETGQPMHAFDADVISDNGSANIIVRTAKDSEKIKLLDETDQELAGEDIVIANEKEILAVAGVMGGEHSGISDTTKTIVLEAANFHPTMIRKTRTRFNMQTESAYRFERHLDPNLAERAMARATELLEEIAGGKVVGGSDIYSELIKSWTVELSTNKVSKLLGEEIPKEKIIEILKNIGCDVSGETLQCNVSTNDEDGGKLFVTIPTIRLDLQTQEDVIEEIGRLYGYHNIASQPLRENIDAPEEDARLVLEKDLRQELSAQGLDEILTYSFYGNKEVEIFSFDRDQHYTLQNPMNPSQEFVRISVLPNVLLKVKENLRYFETFSLYEIGKVYLRDEKEPKEFRELVAAIISDAKGGGFFEMKGILTEAIQNIFGKQLRFDREGKLPTFLHPSRSVSIVLDNKQIGEFGEIHPVILKKLGIKKRIVVAEINLAKLVQIHTKQLLYKELPKFPSVSRDLSLFVPDQIYAEDIEKVMKKAGGKLLQSVELFDNFEKDGKRSCAFRFTFGLDDRTLEAVEVDSAMENIMSEVEKMAGVEIRK